METLTIQGNTVCAITPEGQSANMTVDDLVAKLTPPRMDTCGVFLPEGVGCVLSQGPTTIWVHQTPPRVWNFKWIADDSPVRFGAGTRYRNVRIALPYLVTLAVFTPVENAKVQLSAVNECFFRTAPLSSLDDELLYPALLNCSKFTAPEGKPLAWICTQHLDRKVFINEPDLNRRMRLGFKALMHTLLETGFNYSSERHEGSSWFTESAGVDPRIATVDKWQLATNKDPLFVLEVPWLKTGHTLAQVCERIFQNLKARKPRYSSAGDLARLVFNHKAS